MGPITVPMASNRCAIRKRSNPQITSTIPGAINALRFASGIGAVLIAVSSPVVVAQTAAASSGSAWGFEPQISIRESYTDNVGLVRGDAKKSEFITEVSPGFSIISRGARANFDVNYNINTLFYYRDNDRNTLNHQLRANGAAELVEDWVFLESRANISQQAVSAFGPIGSNSSTSNNKQTLRSFSVSPYLRHAFGRQATAEARYAFSKQSTNGGSTSVSDSESNSVLLKVDSGPAYQDWGWGTAYSREQINYERSVDSTFENWTESLRYRINPRLIAIGTFGYDRNDYFTAGDNPQGAFWSVGGDWRPGRRTAVNFSAGRRYFGATYAFNANHATQRTSWDFTYQRNLSTSRSQFDQPIGVSYRQIKENSYRAENPQATDEEVRRAGETAARDFKAQGGDPDSVSGINFQTNTAFVEKKFQGVVSVQLPKTRLSFTAFDSVRDSSTDGTRTLFNKSGDFALSNVIKQSGVNGQVTYRLSARNNVNLGLDYSRVRLVDISRTDNLSSFNLGISRKLSHTANGSLGYRFIRRDSNFDANDYDENAFFGSLNLTF